jgi:hypothetical protein
MGNTSFASVIDIITMVLSAIAPLAEQVGRLYGLIAKLKSTPVSLTIEEVQAEIDKILERRLTQDEEEEAAKGKG